MSLLISSRRRRSVLAGLLVSTAALTASPALAQLDVSSVELFDRSRAGITGARDSSHTYGVYLASGDFDGDGYADLAVHSSEDDQLGFPFPGEVHLLYGPLSGTPSEDVFDQGTPGLATPEPVHRFGIVAAGDFDQSNEDDLVVADWRGGPYPDGNVLTETGLGGVHVLYGDTGGPTTTLDDYWNQASPGVSDSREDQDHFGAAVVAGDFDGDGFEDLAVGVPGEDIDDVDNAGAAHVLFGAVGGLNASGEVFLHRNSGPIDEAETDARFGAALAAGDIDDDGNDDLVVGIPGEDGCGAVAVYLGPLTLNVPSQTIGLGDLGLCFAGYEFGSSLAMGDVDGDGHADLVVAAPEATDTSLTSGGVVWWFPGDDTGLLTGASESERFHLANLDDTTVDRVGALLGDALAVADFDGDGDAEIAIGAPGLQSGRGRLYIVRGGPAGPRTDLEDIQHLDDDATGDTREPGDFFAGSLAAGDFDDDGLPDLAVGIRGEDPVDGRVVVFSGDLALPDLAWEVVTGTDSVDPGDSFSLFNRVENIGPGPAGPSTIDFRLSDNDSCGLLTDEFLTSRSVGSIATNGSNGTFTSVAIPAGTPVGQYWVCVFANSDFAVEETNYSNNSYAHPITVGDLPFFADGFESGDASAWN